VIAEEEEEEEDYEQIEVPYQYEVEEVQERPVVKEETVEKTIPQVKALYPYKGQGINIDKGEVSAGFVFKCLQLYKFFSNID
jgi:spectrin beta